MRMFRGVPFGAPPVGALRWKPPQPVKPWHGVRKADAFGPRPMQLYPFGDMNFRSEQVSEDCLYLNIWTAASSPDDLLPVLVYFYGGGNIAGDGSEPRYDGEALARRGLVSVTVNYRLHVFGFMAHPELTAESPCDASGNYGYLDQVAALNWVRENIAAFGGDPQRVTIAGESAGSISVSILMCSPLSRGLIAGAIGESGAGIPPTLEPWGLTRAEERGSALGKALGATSLADLRAMPAMELLERAEEKSPGIWNGTLDGYLLTKPLAETLSAGEQARVPLLVGWNSEEMGYAALMGGPDISDEAYIKVVRERFGAAADEILRLYPGSSPDELKRSATALAGDSFIAFSTWKWSDAHASTSDHPVFRYLYARPRPPMTPEFSDAVAALAGGVVRGAEAEASRMPPATGAVHSAEIEYALGNLATNKVYAWTADDYALSDVMQRYFSNFVRSGDPNGAGLPAWPAINRSDPPQVMILDVESRAVKEEHRDRYLLLERVFHGE
jgi:para-nitrobenzyl esterase